jgi:hypothetical protein
MELAFVLLHSVFMARDGLYRGTCVSAVIAGLFDRHENLGSGDIHGIFIGNTIESILHRVKCDILALKPARFVSPIT